MGNQALASSSSPRPTSSQDIPALGLRPHCLWPAPRASLPGAPESPSHWVLPQWPQVAKWGLGLLTGLTALRTSAGLS